MKMPAALSGRDQRDGQSKDGSAQWISRRCSAARNSLEDEIPGRLRSARKMNATKLILPITTSRCFLVQIKVIVDFEEELAAVNH